MGCITRCFILSVFAAVAYGRSLSIDSNNVLQYNNCSCDWRFYRHYEIKECVLEKVDSCGCPQRFICPVNETEQASAKVCIYQNKEYKVGSKIIASDICQACRCRDGVPPYLSCVTRECPEIEVKPGKNCHLVYNGNKCCPISIECIESETDVFNKTCEYNGKYYPFGSKIYPIDDPCQTCVCDENWNGVDNSSCYQHDCMFEKNKAKLNAGCIPVYHESRCCPIEFYCPSSHNLSYSLLANNESSDNYNISNGDQCSFSGQFYAVGQELSISNSCVKCYCAVPPDFTCIHQTCSPPPNEENCYAVYTVGECCPSYECMLGDGEPLPDGCPTPLCADSSCHIEIPPGHECPTCVCGERFSELEHNNFEQVQQISQTMDQFDLVEPRQEYDSSRVDSNDSSEGVLQMMPIRMQNPESELPSSEIASDPEFNSVAEDQSNSIEDNSSIDSVHVESEEQITEKNSTTLAEPELNNTSNEFMTNQSEKVLQKRSDVSDAANNYQTKVIPVDERNFFQQSIQSNADLEREGGESHRSNGAFDDELESFRNKIDKNKTIINEIISINHVIKVPPGCPTPMCEGSWCKIGIPPGERCPTCICQSPSHSEP